MFGMEAHLWGSMKNTRDKDLAKIHIARKDLCLDEDTYRAIIRDIGKVPSGSSADLTATGRAKVLAHFRSKGWQSKPSGSPGHAQKEPGMASNAMIRKIRHLWLTLADNGVVKSRDEAALRAWVKSATKHLHPKKVGYAAPEFLPTSAASNVIEQLKKWADRNGIST